ncbi:MAG TPA: hypothetical protein VF548_05700, partial [Allosphingosinicella sp.]
PQLKDFSLPGQRTTPPATPAPAPVPAPRLPAADPGPPPEPAPATREPPAAAPARARQAPDRAAGTAPAPPAAAPEPAAAAPEAQPEPAEPVQAPPPASAGPAAEAVPVPPPAAAPQAVPAWVWPAAGGALLLVLAAVFLLRRRRALGERESERDLARESIGGALTVEPEAAPQTRPEPGPRPEAERRPEPEPPAVPAAPAAARPWLELDIVPERAAATENEVYVRYALAVTNKGDSDARNIRIDPRLFNAGAEGEMLAFFQGPIHEQSGSPQVVIPPGGSLKLNGQVAMPNAELREIELGGRRIFVPMVAINVAYDWAGGGAGRTSRSWLVGREAEVPTEKMGPFRLDLGPRIYRSVGRREARLVMV